MRTFATRPERRAELPRARPVQAPDAAAGRRLLGHELAHVLQQGLLSQNGDAVVQRQAAETTEDESVIDSRIDVRAQFALLRLFKGSPEDARDARALLHDVKSGKVKGIYGDDLKVAAVLAGERGKSRWELVPSGQDAIMLDDEFDDSPVLVFKEAAGQKPRLDTALLTAYRGWTASTVPKKAPPAFKLPTLPPPAPGGGSTGGGCTFAVDAVELSTDQCLAPLCGAVQRWQYNAVRVIPPCTFGFNPGDELVEEVSSDGKCTGDPQVKTGRCFIGPGGSLKACTDSYGICKPSDKIFSNGSTCTETMTQKMFIGGPLTNRFFIESHQIVFTFTKTGSGCTTSVKRL